MKKLVSLCLLLCMIYTSFAQNLGNLTGAMTGTSITTAAANAAKQLQTLTSTSATSNPNLSQLQLLGLDPSTIQKYLKQKSEADNAGSQGQMQDVLQDLLQMRIRQDSMQVMMERMEKAKAMTQDVKPNEIFGHDFFGSGKLALFSKSADSKAPDSYILDVNDEINIAVWGYADYNNKLKVNEDGFIQIPEFGRIYVKGLTFGAVKAQIGKRLATFINPSNTKYEITLNYSRTIDVNIVGEVDMPGTYQIPAINSVYNAINAANGITEIGSVRDIQVRRDGKTIKRFDVYEFLFNPLLQENFFLQKGDFIYVSTQSKLVKIAGAIRRPAKYELLKGESLNDLIKFAGGLSSNAYTKSIQVSRINNDKAEIIDIDYDQLVNSNFELKDGDVVTISTIPNTVENTVSIVGSVRYAGKYELKAGYRISDVIKIAGGIRLETYLERAYIKRKLDDNTYVNKKFSLKNILIDENSPDNVLLQSFDQIQLFSKDEFIERFFVGIDGSVIKPTILEYTEGITLNDLLFYAGGLKKEAANSKIEISRVINIDSSAEQIFVPQRTVVQTVTVGVNLEIDEASKAYVLSPMDRVFVRKTYGFDDQLVVTLKGEVKYPGVYPILDKNEKVLDVIERAGGLTPYAFIKNARLTRPDNSLNQSIFHLKDAFADTASRANLILKGGDIIEIPTVNQMVSIKGAIRYPGLDSTLTISGKFVPGKSARWYIKNYAGGFKKGALKKSTMVIYPNRKVDMTRSFIGIKNYPTVDNEGALITVDMKVKKPKPPRGPESALNWNIVLPSVIAALTSIASTITLVFVLKK
ncbi:MAG TPA: SLBB domain-containing protein [Chitinophagales bacterium]|nr:SLBB domain-containing protein [Chitinophagales bacterium]HMW12114.1 SLBB domain-containing protein [Chitinophagales bacterium]HMX59902.1 SLBB domain-containing protein [Chitinophagales bacterium]HMY22729.1 SLBB domain-containing protein [Chitinophagales bacterium]HMZ33526.1 SLBB domain-containing protein [Chitinophagales bacterium]